MSDDIFSSADKMLAAMDFASQQTMLEEKHRKKLGKVLLGFLEVLDSLQSLQEHCDESVRAGHEHVPQRSVEIVVKQMNRALAQAGVDPMDAVGKPVDLDHHEILEVRPSSAEEDGVVLEETQRGYLWKHGVLRRAKVVASKEQDANVSERAEGEDQ